MNVNFYATLRQIVGQKTISFKLQPPISIRELLDEIIKHYPPIQHELLDEAGNLFPHVHIFVNGRDVPYLVNGMETVIDQTDKIDVFPAVGGGGWIG